MNREIKFRAWVDWGFSEMINDYCFLGNDFNFFGHDRTNNNYKVIAVMQFTGMKDCEGVDIYEGDVLFLESFLTKISDSSKVPNSDHVNYYVVEFNSDKKVNSWQLRVIKTTRYENFGLGNTSHSHLWTITDKAKIIGNIYQNPELL
jgi:uncharacterized phage protein (TIGR01671 family)